MLSFGGEPARKNIGESAGISMDKPCPTVVPCIVVSPLVVAGSFKKEDCSLRSLKGLPSAIGDLVCIGSSSPFAYTKLELLLAIGGRCRFCSLAVSLARMKDDPLPVLLLLDSVRTGRILLLDTCGASFVEFCLAVLVFGVVRLRLAGVTVLFVFDLALGGAGLPRRGSELALVGVAYRRSSREEGTRLCGVAAVEARVFGVVGAVA